MKIQNRIVSFKFKLHYSEVNYIFQNSIIWLQIHIMRFKSKLLPSKSNFVVCIQIILFEIEFRQLNSTYVIRTLVTVFDKELCCLFFKIHSNFPFFIQILTLITLHKNIDSVTDVSAVYIAVILLNWTSDPRSNYKLHLTL